MSTLHEHSPSGWHPGEQAMHRLLNSHREGNPTSYGLPAQYGYRVQISPLVAFGTLDAQGRPWTTVWGGERGFTRPIAQNVLGVQGLVDRRFDPVVDAFFGGKEDGEVVRPLKEGDDAKVMAGLSIDLSTRDRVKLAGRMIAGAVQVSGSEETALGDKETPEGVAEVQLAMIVQESLGNCPKYLNKKDIHPHVPSPSLVSDALPLPMEAMKLLAKADLFFLSSTNGETMDTNHRGGPPGLIRVVSNSANSDGDGVVLVYPEFSGNRLYQTLGNMKMRPLVGMVVPDFETGDALYLTGETTILIGQDAARLLPHTKLAVKVTVKAARFVRDSLPFRGDVVDYSPYNPPVRRLASEQQPGVITPTDSASGTAILVKREILTPSIARFTFKLHPSRAGALKRWRPGQHVTLDFSEELDMGWSHMREDDPKSLNDDYIRTFTISNAPPRDGNIDDDVRDGTELEITARKHGPATGLLWRQNLRASLELPVLGFGGEEAFRLLTGSAADGKEAVFVAGGVGITPLLAQAPGVAGDGRPLTVLWSLRAEDLPLAVNTLEKLPNLSGRVKLYVTGKVGEKETQTIKNVEGLGATVVKRRMEKTDVVSKSGDRKKFYLCTAPEMLKALIGWLEGEEVIWESFEY